MLLIGEGGRPPKPTFVITRGYTNELWAMTESCWKQEPSERPEVSEILKALKIAAEQWKPHNGGSPQDYWSPTLCEESDSHSDSEPEDKDVTADAFDSPPHSPLVKTLVPVPPCPVSPPSTMNDETPPEHTPAASDENKILYASKDLLCAGPRYPSQPPLTSLSLLPFHHPRRQRMRYHLELFL